MHSKLNKFLALLVALLFMPFIANSIESTPEVDEQMAEETVIESVGTTPITEADIVRTNTQLNRKSVSLGQKALDFTLPNAYGKQITLSKALERGPVVLSFYRGGWCPICNTQLNAFQTKIDRIKELDAQLIAVTPETPTNAELTMINNKLTFEVLSDSGNRIARDYGILWEIPKEEQEGFSFWLKEATGKTIQDFNGEEGYRLPVPATFIIKPNGKVVYVFKDVNYKNRAEIDDIIMVLEAIKH